MSAYARVYQALTTGRPLRPEEAAHLLTTLRTEVGDELAAALEQLLDGQYRRADGDSDATYRQKRRKYGAAMGVIARLRELAASPLRTTPPHQRNHRSTP